MTVHNQQAANLYKEIQQEIINLLEKADGKAHFVQNKWEKEIGSGLSCVMQNGQIIEKGAVNFSQVKGKFTPNMSKLLGEEAERYAATGISSILHSNNPFVPTIHMNVRHFMLDNGTEWFGGGIDLTPTYVNLSEARIFHRMLKDICDSYDTGLYPKWKTWADDYFFLPHRNETRGIGGIFFDRVKPGEQLSFKQLLKLTAELSQAYPIIYSELIKSNGGKAYTEAQKDWQKIRRGRYVEFNLLYDRGTRFGLESGGNTESILVSLPQEVSFTYQHQVNAESEEAKTQALLKKDIDWLNI